MLPVIFASAPLPQSNLQVCTIVPVRNEAESLWETLEALRLQTDEHKHPVRPYTYEVLVLINNCTDHSYEIAKRYQQAYPEFQLHIDHIQLPQPLANIGTVRRMLMDEAYSRLHRAGNKNGIIASTDGDTLVDSQWIYHIMEEIAQGSDAVGGRILTQNHVGAARRSHLRDVTYRCLLAQAEALIDPLSHDPMPRHFQYFGASLAVTCAMYEQAGRLPQVSCLEDMAFHQALQQQDARIRKSFKVKAYTSARLDGRVSIGLSEQLRKWTSEQDANIQQTVEPVEYSLLLLNVKSSLRRCWLQVQQQGAADKQPINIIAQKTLWTKKALLHEMMNARYFGQLWHKVEQALQQHYSKQYNYGQLIETAITQLRTLIASKTITGAPAVPYGNWVHGAEAAA
ncbi:glycosyltransferase [Mucilaginibacter koreensis]